MYMESDILPCKTIWRLHEGFSAGKPLENEKVSLYCVYTGQLIEL